MARRVETLRSLHLTVRCPEHFTALLSLDVAKGFAEYCKDSFGKISDRQWSTIESGWLRHVVRFKVDRTQVFVEITSMAHNAAGQGELAGSEGRVTTPVRRAKVAFSHETEVYFPAPHHNLSSALRAT